MVPAGQLAAFAAASFILIVIPGPSVLFAVGRALAYGRRIARWRRWQAMPWGSR